MSSGNLHNKKKLKLICNGIFKRPNSDFTEWILNVELYELMSRTADNWN